MNSVPGREVEIIMRATIVFFALMTLVGTPSLSASAHHAFWHQVKDQLTGAHRSYGNPWNYSYNRHADYNPYYGTNWGYGNYWGPGPHQQRDYYHASEDAYHAQDEYRHAARDEHHAQDEYRHAAEDAHHAQDEHHHH